MHGGEYHCYNPDVIATLQAAETVRRLLDPDHVDYGEIEMWGRPGSYNFV